MYIHSVTQRPSSRPGSQSIPSSTSLARILSSRQKPASETHVDREQMVTERGSELLRRQRELRAQAAVLQSSSSVVPLLVPSASLGTPRRPPSASRSGRVPLTEPACAAPVAPVPVAAPVVDPFDLDARVEITEEIARRPPSRKNSAAYDLFSGSSSSATAAVGAERASKPGIPSSSAFKDRPQSRGLEPPAALHLDSPPATPPSAVWAAPAAVLQPMTAVGSGCSTGEAGAEGPTASAAAPGSASMLVLEDIDSPTASSLGGGGGAVQTRPLSRPSSSYLGGQRTQRPPLVLELLPERQQQKQRPTTSSGVFRPPTSGGFQAAAGTRETGKQRPAGRGHSAFRTSLDREFLGLFAN